MTVRELNFDGIVGPSHHYGGLAHGNLASQQNQQAVSHPLQAVLQGLAKMKLLADRGIPQAVLPPHPRPHWEYLRQHGFSGPPAMMLQRAAQERPDLLSTAYSSSSMWAANAATVSPSADTTDGRVHLTPANLLSNAHRALEGGVTARILRQIFSDHRHFVVHDPLPASSILADEGAANQTRLCSHHGQPGLELFTYGRDGDDDVAPLTRKFQPRQTRQAFERIAALHGVDAEHRFFIQQLPEAIDAGVFHNDVICVGNENVLLIHEQAWCQQQQELERLAAAMRGRLHVIQVSASELSLPEAVQTYLFNSQLLSLPGRTDSGNESAMLLVYPSECETHPRARKVIERIVAGNNPIAEACSVDVRQSMSNGGGPACLRLRVVLTPEELGAIQGNVLLTDALYEQLVGWARRHYREALRPAELGDFQLAEECRAAQEELSGILQLQCEEPHSGLCGS